MTKYKKPRGRKPKKAKRYGSKKRTIPQRKNLKTALVSQLPKTGGKPLRMHQFYASAVLDTTASTVDLDEEGGSVAIGVKIQDGLDLNRGIIFQSSGLIKQGDGRDMRNGTRIKLRRLEIIVEAYQKGVSGSDKAFTCPVKVWVIKDKQTNNAAANSAEVILNKMFQGGSTTVMTRFLDFDERNRFTLLGSEKFSLPGSEGATLDTDEHCAHVIKTISLQLKQGIQYDHSTDTGTTGTIASESLWTIVMFLAQDQNQNIIVETNNRIFFTEM